MLAFASAASADLRDWPETAAMLAAPDDAVAVYAFVNRAINEDRLGDAANALERLVRFQPDDAQARIDLIKLYDAIGAGDLADDQRAVLADAGIPITEVRETEVSGFIAVGSGYDTNPAANPRNDVIGFLSPISGQVEDIDLNFSREGSPLAFVQAGVRIAAPTGAPDAKVVFDLSAYGAHFLEDSDQNDVTVALRAGPEITYTQGTIRPFIDVGYRHFGGDPYAVAGAFGVEAVAQMGVSTLSFEISGGYRDYIATDESPGRENLDGAEVQVSATFETVLQEDLFLDLSARAAAVNAAQDFEDYYAFGGDATLTARVTAMDRAFFISGGGGALYSNYKTPDFQLLPFPREEVSIIAFAGLSTSIDEVTTIDAALAYRRRFSNYDIYDSDGLRATIRVARRF